MKTRFAIALALAFTCGCASVAFAQGNSHHGGRHDNGKHHGARNDGRGAGENQRWHRGDRLPIEYRHRNYVVNDWRAHRLNAPPRGYYWVQDGNDYLMVSAASGVIAQLLLGHR